MRQAIAKMRDAAVKVDEDAEWCQGEIEKGIPWWKFWHRVRVAIVAGKTNYKYRML
jgi:hypothetical protein